MEYPQKSIDHVRQAAVSLLDFMESVGHGDENTAAVFLNEATVHIRDALGGLNQAF